MKKQQDQQIVRLRNLVDSNDDGDATSTSSASNDDDSDQSSKITDLMRENERKIRNLTESYMNRFLLGGQQLQTCPEPSNTLAIPSTIRGIGPGQSSEIELETIRSSSPSLTLFVETLKQIIMKEEKKRGLLFLCCCLSFKFLFLNRRKILFTYG